MGAYRQGYHKPQQQEEESTMKIKDFMILCGVKEEKVMLYECDTMETIIVPVDDLMEADRYADIMEADIASWDYDDGIICIYYFL